MRTCVALIAAALLVPPLAVHAQERKSPGLYKVEFNIHDTTGAAKPGLRYTLLIEANRKAVFKVGDRVPVATGSFQPGSNGGSPLVSTQYTYVDVGVNIDCIVSEMDNKVLMHGSIDLSTVVAHEAAARGANPPNPTVGQTKLELDTILEPGKPTVVAAIDDPANSRHFQVEATVVKAD